MIAWTVVVKALFRTVPSHCDDSVTAATELSLLNKSIPSLKPVSDSNNSAKAMLLFILPACLRG